VQQRKLVVEVAGLSTAASAVELVLLCRDIRTTITTGIFLKFQNGGTPGYKIQTSEFAHICTPNVILRY